MTGLFLMVGHLDFLCSLCLYIYMIPSVSFKVQYSSSKKIRSYVKGLVNFNTDFLLILFYVIFYNFY